MRGDAPEMFDFIEEALDEVALFVVFGIEGRRRPPIGLGRDIGDCAGLFDSRSEGVGIVGLVAQDDAALGQRLEQFIGGLAVVGLAWREHKADRPAARVGHSVDLGSQSASAAAHTTISTVFFELAAC